MTGIMCAILGGGSSFAAVFNNAELINLLAGGSPTNTATYTINTAATCSKAGTPSLSSSFGPTAWGTPTGGAPGNDYEARLNVTTRYLDAPAVSYVRFAGVDVATTGFTPWYTLSSNRAIQASSSGQVAAIEGILYIRNRFSLVEISRSFSVYADPTA